MKNPLEGLADNHHTRHSDMRVDGTGKVVMKKQKAKPTQALTIRKRNFTLADVGALVMREADDTVKQQIQDNLLRLGEAVAGRIHYWEGQIEQCKFMLEQFQRKRAAIEAGEFQVNKHDGTVSFHDKSLEKLG